MKIGIIADSLLKPLSEALKEAKALGADGVQIYAKGERWDLLAFSDEELTALRDECQALGLEVAAVCGDLGGHAFQEKCEFVILVKSSSMLCPFLLRFAIICTSFPVA